MMTWRELIERIPEDKIDTDVTILDLNTDEFYPMKSFGWDNLDIVDGSFYVSFWR